MESPQFTPDQERELEARVDQGVGTVYDEQVALTGLRGVRPHIPPAPSAEIDNPGDSKSRGGYDIVSGPGNLFADPDAKEKFKTHRASYELEHDWAALKRIRKEATSGNITPAGARARFKTHLERHGRLPE